MVDTLTPESYKNNGKCFKINEVDKHLILCLNKLSILKKEI